jgi:hypothetical protein
MPALPDLPADLFGEDVELYAEAVPRPRRKPSTMQPETRQRDHRWESSAASHTERDSPRRPSSRPQPAQRPAAPKPTLHPAATRVDRDPALVQDIVTSMTMRPELASRRATREPRSRAWTWSPPVFPQPMQMLDQALPNVVTAASAGLVLLLGTFSPLGVPLWAAGLFIPTVLLAILANGVTHLGWKRAALINIATLAMVFPVLVVRQSVVRIPFVDSGNGTLLAPSVATVAVILLLALLALACAVLCQEDPEFAGVVFLPAAMMVPLMAGQSDIINLSSALAIAAAIFAISAGLSVLASMLPGAFPTLVAPITIGLEFVLLTAFRDASIFPTGAGTAAKVLFVVIVVATVALASLAPSASGWIRQVTRLSQSRQYA